jgi:hypothetical protein
MGRGSNFPHRSRKYAAECVRNADSACSTRTWLHYWGNDLLKIDVHDQSEKARRDRTFKKNFFIGARA